MSLQAALSPFVEQLESTHCERPQVDLELMAAHLLNCSRGEIYLTHQSLSSEMLQQLEHWTALRAQGVPLQHLLGQAWFYGRAFEVNAQVLVPRPETEVLLQTAIDALAQNPSWKHVLDVGTGSGVLGVSLKLECPHLEVVATDISTSALQVAERNMHKHQAPVRLIVSDGFHALEGEVFDMIVSNPPYLTSEEMERLPVEVHWDPPLALHGGADGLELVRGWLPSVATALVSGGTFLFEMGEAQSAAVAELCSGTALELEQVVPDLNGRDRVSVLRKR